MHKGLAILQGTTVLFGKLARDPSFSSKITRFFALAPITTARKMRGPMTALHYIQPILHVCMICVHFFIFCRVEYNSMTKSDMKIWQSFAEIERNLRRTGIRSSHTIYRRSRMVWISKCKNSSNYFRVCHYDQLTSICESILSMLGGSSGKGILNLVGHLLSYLRIIYKPRHEHLFTSPITHAPVQRKILRTGDKWFGGISLLVFRKVAE